MQPEHPSGSKADPASGDLQLLVQPDPPSSSPVQLTVQQQQQSAITGTVLTPAAVNMPGPGGSSGSSSSGVCNVRAIQQGNLAAEPAMQLVLAQAGTLQQAAHSRLELLPAGCCAVPTDKAAACGLPQGLVQQQQGGGADLWRYWLRHRFFPAVGFRLVMPDMAAAADAQAAGLAAAGGGTGFKSPRLQQLLWLRDFFAGRGIYLQRLGLSIKESGTEEGMFLDGHPLLLPGRLGRPRSERPVQAVAA
ncbi:hypothetical protein OEZ86_009589 [Tetradesmus obliquus]|nr:hypothetical protein OEZ86_009589 [Tetradesmus obliquus]